MLLCTIKYKLVKIMLELFLTIVFTVVFIYKTEFVKEFFCKSV